MSAQVSDDVFLAFLEAAVLEEGHLEGGDSLAAVQVARTAGLDLAVVRSCIERLVAEGLGYTRDDEPGMFQIVDDRVQFARRKLERAAAKRPAVVNYNISGVTAGAISIGDGSSSSGSVNHIGTGRLSPGQGAAAPPSASAVASSGGGATASSEDAGIDFAILTAIEVERRAVCAAFGLGDDHRVRKGSRVYWRGRLPLRNGEFYELVVAQSPDMANIDAAILTNDTLHHWQPVKM